MAYIEMFILCIVLLYLLYKWSVANYDTLTKRGIAHDKPKPLIGNIQFSLLFGRSPFLPVIIENHLRFKKNKVYGVYSLRSPRILLADAALIKQIGVKEFEHFTNHPDIFPDVGETFMSRSLFALKDRKWKEMRNTLTPTFTGSKMRLMYELINACSLEGVAHIETELKKCANGEIELEMKDFFTRFANDVIATAAFGIGVNSFKDQNNEFYTIGKTMLQFSYFGMLKFMLMLIAPKIFKVLRIPIFDTKSLNYFKSLVFDAMKYRAAHHIIRPDMIQLLMEAQRNFVQQKKEEQPQQDDHDHAEFNDDDLLAQCMLFFFAGFDTVSTALSFTCYELIMNLDVQERLYEEILETEKLLNGAPLHYEALMNMKYLDMVIAESLRKWPPAFTIERICATDVELRDDEDNMVVNFKRDDVIHIPIIGLHHDPEYFAEPAKFKPERFSDENKAKVRPFTYFPFGIGPRSCIGNRLALMEIKSMIYYLLLNFKLLPTERTTKDMINRIFGFRMQPKELFWTKVVPRNIE